MVACRFVLFLLAIVLSVLLRYTDSDYPFGIFKLFLLYVGYNRCGIGKHNAKTMCIWFMYYSHSNDLILTKILHTATRMA